MKRKSIVLSMLVLIATSTSFGVQAENKLVDNTLDAVVVTADRTTQSEFKSKADVYVITRKQIEENHYADLNAALKTVPGVTVQNYGVSGENYSANRLWINGSAKVVILINGVRLNRNASNSSAFQVSEFSNMDRIERIEVLKGSASTLYGADAQGGVINIITRMPQSNTNHTHVGLVVGSYGHNTETISNYGNQNGLYWNLTGQRNKWGNYSSADGKTIIQDIDSKSFDIQVGKIINDKHDVSVTFNRYYSDYARPSVGGFKNITTKTGTKSNVRYGLQWNYQIADEADRQISNQVNLYKNDSYVLDGTEKGSRPFITDISTVGISDQVTYIAHNHRLVGGFDIYQDRVYNYGSVAAPASLIKDKHLNTRAVYLQDTYTFAPNWTITPGIRYTNSSYFGNNTSGSLGIAYTTDNLNAYASYNQFFVPPSQSELFGPYGTPTLLPAKGGTLQIGLKKKFNKTLSAEFAAYRTKAENLVAFDYGTFKYQNIAKETTYGWSLGMQKQINDNLSLRLAYNNVYMPTENVTKNPNRDGYVPRGAVNLTARYEQGKFNALLIGQGIYDRPGRKSVEATIPNDLKTFWIWNAVLNYYPTKDSTIYLRVNNLFNKLYTDQLYQADINSNQWFPAPGRNYEVGVSYRF